MGLIFDWRSVFWFGLLAIIFVMEQNRFSYLRPAGVMDTKAVLAGEWWRLCTAVMLHKDFSHLVSNVTFGIVLLGLAMGAFGAGPALLAAFLAGVGGNIAGLVIYSEIHRSLGASGMVMGALGLLTAHSLWHFRSTVTTKQLAGRGLLGGILLLVLLGLNPDSDVIAHVGGFVAGVMLGSILSWLPPELLHKPSINRLSELFCCGLVVLTWWLALV